MKKEMEGIGVVSIVLIIIVLALIASNIFFWISLNKANKAIVQLANVSKIVEGEEAKELRVYFTIEDRQIRELDTDELCTKVCSERKYDGYAEGTLTRLGSSYKYECKCYMIVRAA